jgi:hypothetical protein
VTNWLIVRDRRELLELGSWEVGKLNWILKANLMAQLVL